MADFSVGGGVTGRIRKASVSLMSANPQLGMWQATGTAIAQAPNLTELRAAESGGDNIHFDAQGHSIRTAVREPDGELAIVPSRPTDLELKSVPVLAAGSEADDVEQALQRPERRYTLEEKHVDEPKHDWGGIIMSGLRAFWKFFCTPSGFCIVIYFLNIVAWGAMLFFLLLKAAPAMNHPTADDDQSPRKIWLEIDSQILNALFCVTGFGLAPWRFRDLYFFVRAVGFHDRRAMRRLSAQNKGWFRPPMWVHDGEEGDSSSRNPPAKDKPISTSMDQTEIPVTFTGRIAPPTALWKLGFCVIMMVLNTLIQAVLSYYMWGYNRLDRPTWATGTFIGLGCGVAALAGLMSWWEGRKVKKIEGPSIRVVEGV